MYPGAIDTVETLRRLGFVLRFLTNSIQVIGARGGGNE
jgi:hypothetical protein